LSCPFVTYKILPQHMSKQPPGKSTTKKMTLAEAETYLRKVGEWHDVVKLERETIIKWAEFLKKKENIK